MGLHTFDRAMLYRWLASGLFWLLVLAVVFISIRSTNIVARVSRAAAGAMTVCQEQDITGVRELARAFAVEWATWTSSPDDYTRRLGLFLKRPDIATPDGVQEVTAASVQSADSDGEKYRVRVLLHTRRLIPLTLAEAQALPPAFIPVSREDLIKIKQEGLGTARDREVLAWRDYLICVEVPVTLRHGRPEINGPPVIVSPGVAGGEIVEAHINETAPPDLVGFVGQFLGLYYGGGSLANFLALGASVVAIPGWKLESVGEVRVDDSKIPSLAYIRATVSAPGVGRLEQRIYMLVHLERGSYLVKDVRANNKNAAPH